MYILCKWCVQCCISQKSASPSKSTTSEASGSKSSGRTPISHRSNPPKPAARTKPVTTTTSTTKVSIASYLLHDCVIVISPHISLLSKCECTTSQMPIEFQPVSHNSDFMLRFSKKNNHELVVTEYFFYCFFFFCYTISLILKNTGKLQLMVAPYQLKIQSHPVNTLGTREIFDVVLTIKCPY